MAILALLTGYKTYVAAAGLVGLSVYQFSIGEYPTSVSNPSWRPWRRRACARPSPA